MPKQKLLLQLNDFLDQGPFTDEEIRTWKERALNMKEVDIVNFFELIKEKSKILTDTNKLFVKIAEDALEIKEKRQKEIPKELYIADMQIQDVVNVVKKNLLALVENEKVGIFTQFNQFFKNSMLVGDNVIQEFQALEKAILFNKEIFTKEEIPIGRWLIMYNAFKGKILRKSIDRINFAHQNKDAKKITDEERKILLKILKFYDFLLDPSNVEIGVKPRGLSKLEQRKSYQEIKSRTKKETSFKEKVSLETDSSKLAGSDAVCHQLDNTITNKEDLSTVNKKSSLISGSHETRTRIPAGDKPRFLPVRRTTHKERLLKDNYSTKKQPLKSIIPKPTAPQSVAPKLITPKPIKPKAIIEKPIIKKPVVQELSQSQQQVKKLQELLKQYPEDSLVSKAIKEEIEKLK